ncbi:MAG: hypothetical protein ACKOBM_04305 [Gammaproteobacteria bacterium]
MLASTTTLAASTYTLTVLPPLAGYQDAFASSINDLGQVAGYVNNPLTPQFSIGFVHRAGVTTAVGKLSAKGTFATAVYVSPTGVVVGDGDTGDGRPQGIVKPGATVYNVYPNNGGNTHALKADAQGRVYGYFIRRGNSNWQGAMWTPNPKKVGTYTETILGGPGIHGVSTRSGKASATATHRARPPHSGTTPAHGRCVTWRPCRTTPAASPTPSPTTATSSAVAFRRSRLDRCSGGLPPAMR